MTAPPTLQSQARALGDPTRHSLFRYLIDAGTRVDVAELTDHVGLNHNAVRQHLAKLVDAGLVVETRAPPTGRGRPRLLYEVNPAADSRWGTTGPYERLATYLAEITRTGETPVEVGTRVGRRSRSGQEDRAGPIDQLVDEMARHGFDPSRRDRGETVEVVLGTCPFASAVVADPETVCDLHLGLARGVAERTGGLRVDELIAHDPHRANCRLRVRLTGATPHERC